MKRKKGNEVEKLNPENELEDEPTQVNNQPAYTFSPFTTLLSTNAVSVDLVNNTPLPALRMVSRSKSCQFPTINPTPDSRVRIEEARPMKFVVQDSTTPSAVLRPPKAAVFKRNQPRSK